VEQLLDSPELGPIIFGIVASAFFALLVLAGRKMARGLHKDELEARKEPEQLEAGGEEPGEEGEEEPLRDTVPVPPPPGVLPSTLPPPAAKTTAPVPTAETAQAAMDRGLAKTRLGFMARLNGVLFGKGLDPSLVDELEEILVTSDIGIRTAERLLGGLRNELSRKEVGDPKVVQARLRAKIGEILAIDCPPLPFDQVKPVVIMVIGVNGAGKTTTIGKLAARLQREGKKVVLAAGDTFRAAAVEQLEVWAKRAGADIVRGPERADPSSVVFEAIKQATQTGADVCIVDTAGRLQTKVNLMEELKKVRRVMEKAMAGTPHEVMLVLDATTGQNAISQAKHFTEAVQVSSIALTKLDGTAKGGVVVAICDALGLPVRLVGVGETIEDLRDFDPDAFVDALFKSEEGVALRAAQS
jgi:fused signal recognition particle receptor